MSKQEGPRLIKLAGVWISALTAVFWIVSSLVLGSFGYAVELFVFCLAVFVIGAALMAVGWILEGFAA